MLQKKEDTMSSENERSEFSRLRLMADFGDRFLREGGRVEDIHRMAYTPLDNPLPGLVGVLRGTHEIRAIEHVIDLAVPCGLPSPAIKVIQPRMIIPVRIKVDWDEPLEAKVKRGDRQTIAWATEIADDQHYPSDRRGSREVEATIIHFGRLLSQAEIETYAASVDSEPAHPKALADLMLQNRRPELDGQMPLAAPVLWAGLGGGRDVLYAGCCGFDKRGLNRVWLGPSGEWGNHWWFLLLRKYN